MLSAIEFYALVQGLLLALGAAAALFTVQRVQQARVQAMDERCELAVEALDSARQLLGDIATRGGGERVEQLEAEVRTLEVALAEKEEALADFEGAGDREEQLKQLVQQFTKDSREMLQCIRKLEDENAELRKRLDGVDGAAG